MKRFTLRGAFAWRQMVGKIRLQRLLADITESNSNADSYEVLR